jgi:hypothetical protein
MRSTVSLAVSPTNHETVELASNEIHHRKPGQVGGPGDPGDQRHQQRYGGAHGAETARQPGADDIAKNATGREFHGRRQGRKVQMLEAAEGEQRHHDATRVNQAAIERWRVAGEAAIHAPTEQNQDDWQQECRVAKHLQHDIGEPGAERSAYVVDIAVAAAERPARIAGVVTEQADEQIEHHRRHRNQQQFAAAPGRRSVCFLWKFPGFRGSCGQNTNDPKVPCGSR